MTNFQVWFWSAPHRFKYHTDHPAYLAGEEAWIAALNLVEKAVQERAATDEIFVVNAVEAIRECR